VKGKGGCVVDEIDDVVSRWCTATARRDPAAAADCLSSEVVLSSPLAEDRRVRGRQQVRELLTIAFTAIESIDFHTRLDGPACCALFARATFGSMSMEEAVLLRVDETDGLIGEITLFVRPLPALLKLKSVLDPSATRG
jgi:hypothetical protein